MDGDTRDTIRAVALELFSTKGFEQTSLREIAERVGLTKASLYYHYPSKQALLLAVVAPVVDGWRGIADETVSLERTPANIRQIMARCLDVLLSNRVVAAVFQRDPAGVAVVAGALWEDSIALARQMATWLAGPAATPADRLRAAAAMEVLGGALAVETYFEASEFTDADMRSVLLAAAVDVLRLPAEPAESEMRNVG